MGINLDSSGIFTYFIFLGILAITIWLINHIVKKNKKIKDIRINPFAVLFGFLFLIGLWLGDLTTLDLGTKGFGAMVGMNPVPSSKVPALFIWAVSLLAMFSINYFFLKINQKTQNKKEHSPNKMIIYTQLWGLIVFTISALAMGIFGYETTFLGFYLLNLYHSTLPLIIFTLFLLVANSK